MDGLAAFVIVVSLSYIGMRMLQRSHEEALIMARFAVVASGATLLFKWMLAF